MKFLATQSSDGSTIPNGQMPAEQLEVGLEIQEDSMDSPLLTFSGARRTSFKISLRVGTFSRRAWILGLEVPPISVRRIPWDCSTMVEAPYFPPRIPALPVLWFRMVERWPRKRPSGMGSRWLRFLKMTDSSLLLRRCLEDEMAEFRGRHNQIYIGTFLQPGRIVCKWEWRRRNGKCSIQNQLSLDFEKTN